MRACVIFNPAAQGNKAGRFRRWLAGLEADCALKPTASPGAARALAAEAVNDGFNTIVAAGGDGTVNEVLNGVGDAPEGYQRARLAVLPLGTVNVFAKELKMPAAIPRAWAAIRAGREIRIDLPFVDFQRDGRPVRRYFAQLAGAGLDARAIELVSWELKKKVGPLSYVAAGLRAMGESLPLIQFKAGTQAGSGQLILLGNGRLYGGRFKVFPQADLSDGKLDVCVFPKVNWPTLLHCGTMLLATSVLPGSHAQHLTADSLELSGPPGTPFEVDGELCGHLPATFGLEPGKLRVIAP